MNYLNGGYVMIKHNATQTELKNAYESKKPVVYYDATGKAEYATIVKKADAYYVFKVNEYAKKYSIEITFDDTGDIPSTDTVYMELITKNNLLYLNSDVAEDAQELFMELSSYTPDCIVSPGSISEYLVLGGYLTNEGTIVITYNDGNGAVKVATLECGNATTIKTYLM